MTNIWRHHSASLKKSPPSSIPRQRGPHRTRLPRPREDVLISGRPIGSWPSHRPPCRSRFVAVTTSTPSVSISPAKWATMPSIPARPPSPRSETLGMQKASTSASKCRQPAGFTEMIDNMCPAPHRRPRHPRQTHGNDWRKIIFTCSPSAASTAAKCTRPGTKCPSSSPPASTSPPLSPPLQLQGLRKGFAAMIGGQTGKVILDWSLLSRCPAREINLCQPSFRVVDKKSATSLGESLFGCSHQAPDSIVVPS